MLWASIRLVYARVHSRLVRCDFHNGNTRLPASLAEGEPDEKLKINELGANLHNSTAWSILALLYRPVPSSLFTRVRSILSVYKGSFHPLCLQGSVPSSLFTRVRGCCLHTMGEDHLSQHSGTTLVYSGRVGGSLWSESGGGATTCVCLMIHSTGLHISRHSMAWFMVHNIAIFLATTTTMHLVQCATCLHGHPT